MSEITKDELEAEYYRGLASGRKMECRRQLRELADTALSEIDDILADLEDKAHGRTGEQITRARHLLAQYL